MCFSQRKAAYGSLFRFILALPSPLAKVKQYNCEETRVVSTQCIIRMQFPKIDKISVFVLEREYKWFLNMQKRRKRNPIEFL